jgi:D-cysteine desulfhydrase family pyridoxal phosphate-dependent enzyme
MNLHEFPRIPLAGLPTPLEEAPRLTAALGGPRILIKRDDLTGLALGGNKARKLEFLMAGALAEGADTVMTTGAADSNHCRMTAAAAARLGLRCVLLLGAQSESPPVQGNLLLDHLFGAEILYYPAGGKISGNRLLPEVTEFVRARGNKPYTFCSGGSTGLGALGYALMVEELTGQLAARDIRADHVVAASGSSGTHAGLLLGAALFRPSFTILAINVDEPDNDVLEPRTRDTYAEGAELLGLPGSHAMPEFILRPGYVGEGYGILSAPGAEAIRLLARTEGILLDPVYSSKAMAGLIDLIRRGEIGADKTVVFVHTGGAPALFTQAAVIVERGGVMPSAPPLWWRRTGQWAVGSGQ